MSNSVTKFGMNRRISPNLLLVSKQQHFEKTFWTLLVLWCVTATENKTEEWGIRPQKRENGESKHNYSKRNHNTCILFCLCIWFSYNSLPILLITYREKSVFWKIWINQKWFRLGNSTQSGQDEYSLFIINYLLWCEN